MRAALILSVMLWMLIYGLIVKPIMIQFHKDTMTVRQELNK